MALPIPRAAPVMSAVFNGLLSTCSGTHLFAIDRYTFLGNF
jgi:hypothetical protein